MDPRLAAYREILNYDIDILKEYRSELHNALETTIEKFRTYVENHAGSMPENSREDWSEIQSGRYWELADDFPKIMNNSLFISIYNYLESSMKWISEYLQETKPSNIKIDDLRGKGIKLYKKYLEKIHGLTPTGTKEWHKFATFNHVRNYIIHSNGRLDDSGKAKNVREYARSNKQELKIDECNSIVVLDECNEQFIESVYNYISSILNSAQSLDTHISLSNNRMNQPRGG